MKMIKQYETKSASVFNGYKKNMIRKQANERHNEQLICSVDAILEMMSNEKAEMIRREYLQKRKKKWWEGYYSKSTYYRIRGKALQEFLNLLK